MKLTQGEWRRGEELGVGGMGRVFAARDAAGRSAALKLIPKEPGADRELLIADALVAQQSPNVIPIWDHGETDDAWVIVMPRADATLSDHLTSHSPLPLDEVVSILRDVAAGLADVASLIVHRDIKPANVLHWDGRWCLADFGISRYADVSTAADTRKWALTPPYAAPEQWRGEHATAATDIYSFGVIAYELLAGQRPFPGPTPQDYRLQHLQDAPPPIDAIPAWLRSLVAQCLLKPPGARPTASAVVACLSTVHAAESGRSGVARLEQANVQAIQSIAEIHAQEERKRDRSARRAELFSAATSLFDQLTFPLIDTLKNYGPAVAYNLREAGHLLFAHLDPVTLRITTPERVAAWVGPFDVIAMARIGVDLGSSRGGWKGRTHALWFCDPGVRGQYAWYELAFRGNPMLPELRVEEPFALDPESASPALRPGMNVIQLGWPLTELTTEATEEFVDRWIGWFADAASSALQRPHVMPDRSVTRWWRQDGSTR